MSSKDKNLTPVQQEYKKIRTRTRTEKTCLKKIV